MSSRRTMRSVVASLFTRSVARPRRSLPFGRTTFDTFEDRVVPATFTVLNGADAGPGSLRQAVLDANAAAGADEIVITGGAGQVGLTGPRLDLTDAVGIGGFTPSVSGVARTGGTGGLFNVAAGVTAKLESLTLRGGTGANGGAIESRGNLTLDRVLVTNNAATGEGGGVYAEGGVVSISGSTFTANTAAGSGGGISYSSGTGASSLTMVNATINGNTSGATGGGVALSVLDQGTALLTNCTVSSNTAALGGGGLSTFQRTTLFNTLVSGNTSTGQPSDLSAGGLNIPISGSNNLVGDAGTAGGLVNGQNGNLIGVDPRLGALREDTGPLPTQTLLLGSPALNAGTNARVLNVPTDANANSRVQDGTVDIGATEGVAAALVVSSADDAGPGTLRTAVLTANAAGGGDISFAPALNGQTITLTSDQLTVNSTVRIVGPGAANLTIVAQNGRGRVVQVSTAAGNLTISGLTLRGGTAEYGGAVYVNNARATVDGCVVTGARGAVGGALASDSVLVVRNTHLTDNVSQFVGGGIYIYSGSVLVENSTFSNNSARFGGALVVQRGTGTVVNSTFSGNAALAGGTGSALRFEPGTTITLSNVTVAGNTGGPAIANSGTTTINNSILGGNTDAAGQPADLVVLADAPPALTVFNSLVQDGGGKANLAAGANGNLLGADPKLGLLQNNGGSTPTRLPAADSPAGNAGNRDRLPAGVALDQRGQPRVFGTTQLDMGSVETDIASPPNAVFTVAGVNINTLGLSATTVNGVTTYKGPLNFALTTGGETTNLSFDAGANALGLVVENGKVTQFQASVNAGFTVKGLKVEAKNLVVTYAAQNDVITITGGAGIGFTASGGDNINLNAVFGGPNTTGLEVRNGQLVKLDATINSGFTIKGVEFNATDVRLTYDAGPALFTATGAATLKFSAAGRDVNLGVTLGEGDYKGLVVQNGVLQELAVKVNAQFAALGLTFDVDNLGVRYSREAGEFAVAGGVRVTSADQSGTRVFNNLSVQLGSSFTAPGIRVVNGQLTELDIKVNAQFNLFGLTIQAEDLRVQFNREAANLQFTGAVQVTVVSGAFARVNLPNGGITINTQTGQVVVNGVSLQIGKLKLGPVEVQDFFLEYKNTNGVISVAGRGMVSLLNGRVVISGEFEVVNGRLRTIGLTGEFSPGLPIVQGAVFLTKIGGKISNLDNPEQLQVDVNVRLTVGPSVNFGGTRVSVADVDGMLSVNSQRLVISGQVSVLGGLLGQASGSITFQYAEPQFVQVQGNFTAYFGILKGNFDFRVDPQGNVDAAVRLDVQTPDFFPTIGPIKLGGVNIGTFTGNLRIRPNSSEPSDNRLSLTGEVFVLKASLTVYLKDAPNNPGRRAIDLYVDVPIFPDFRRTWLLNGSGGQAADGSMIGSGDVTEQAQASVPDGDPSAPAPTLAINGVEANAGAPTGTVNFTSTAATNTGGTRVTLFVDRDNSGFDGTPISVNLPYRAGSQAFSWNDLATFADAMYDPRNVLFVYGVIDDGVHAPVYSAYSSPVVPPDYSPTLVVPAGQKTKPGQTVVFSAAAGTAIVLTDPLQPFDATTAVTVELRVDGGTLTLGTLPAGVTASGTTDDVLTLTGSAAAVTIALDGLTYTPDAGEFFDDILTVSVTRNAAYPGGARTATVALDTQPLGLTGTTTQPYTQRSGPVSLLADIALSSAATDVIDGAVVRVDGFVPGLDLLTYADQAGIVGLYDPQTGELLLSGSASVAAYQQAIRAISFDSAAAEDRDVVVTVYDLDGNQAELTVAVSVTPAARPPVVRQVAVGAIYAPGGRAVALDRQLAVAYPGGTTLTGATVTFAEGYVVGQDMLAFADQNGITGSFDAASGVLTLTGTATATAYRNALRTITYSNAAAIPASGVRTLAVSVLDDALASAPALLRVFVSADVTSLNPTRVEVSDVGVALSALDRAVTLSPFVVVLVDSVPTLTGATVAITEGFVVGEDYLIVGTLPAGIMASYDPLTGRLTLSGVASATDYTTALASVRYTNPGDIRTAGDRVLTFGVTDGLTAPDTADVTLTVDGPPAVQVDAGALQYTPGDGAVAVEPGVNVIYRGGFSVTGATVAFTFGYMPAEDRLEFDAQNGITGTFDAATGVLTLTGSASADEYQDALRSVRYRNLMARPNGGERELMFAVTDGTAGSDALAGRTLIDVALGDARAVVTVNAGPVAFAERADAVALLPGLTLTGPDGSDPILFGATVDLSDTFVKGEDVLAFTAGLGITGTFYPDTGELILSGAAPLSAYQAVLRSVTYRNLSAAPSTAPRQVTVTLDDGIPGGMAAASTTVLPSSADDAPTRTAGSVADLSVATNAGTVSLGLGAVEYAPPAGETSLVYTVTRVPDAGLGRVLLADGTAVVVGGTYTLDQIRGLQFAPASVTATGTDVFAYTVAGTDPATGRTDPAIRTESMNLTVTPAVSPPVRASTPQTAVGAVAGPVARLVNPDGSVALTATPFGTDFTGGVRTAAADFNGDGVADLVVGTGPGGPTRVRVLDGKTGAVLFEVDPFEAAFTGGVFVAAGDLDGDGVPELVVTPDMGGGPRVLVYKAMAGALSAVASFFGIDDPNFRGGARAAVGDFDGDGIGDLLVSAGFGGGPRVAGYSGASVLAGTPSRLFNDLFVFEASLLNGAYVAAGDLDGDGFADIVAGGGPTGGPRVRVLSGKELLAGRATPLVDFLAADASDRNGATVAVKNLDGDGLADLSVGAGSRFRTYRGVKLTAGDTTPDLDNADILGGVFVG